MSTKAEQKIDAEIPSDNSNHPQAEGFVGEVMGTQPAKETEIGKETMKNPISENTSDSTPPAREDKGQRLLIWAAWAAVIATILGAIISPLITRYLENEPPDIVSMPLDNKFQKEEVNDGQKDNKSTDKQGSNTAPIEPKHEDRIPKANETEPSVLSSPQPPAPSNLIVKITAGGTNQWTRDTYEDNATNILRYLAEGGPIAVYDSAGTFLTPRGRERLKTLFEEGAGRIETNFIKAVISYNGDLIEIHSIPIRFPNVTSLAYVIMVFKGGKLDFIRDDENKLLEQMTAGVELLHVNSLDYMKIAEFIGKVKSAYNSKTVSFLDTVFADTAEIRVGKALDMSGSEEAMDYYTRTKRAYLEYLQRAFNKADYISVQFDSLEAKPIDPKQNKKYFVAWYQKWDAKNYSNPTKNYNDRGWVSAHIEFHDNKGWIIERAWQHNDRPFPLNKSSQTLQVFSSKQ